METATNGVRSIRDIAREIRQKWTKVHLHAKPYLDAMMSLETIKDNYGYDDGKGIVLYFLNNARTWHGEDAKRIKAELKALCK